MHIHASMHVAGIRGHGFLNAQMVLQLKSKDEDALT